MTADAGENNFLSRWSRLKQKARTQQAGDGDAPLHKAEAPGGDARSVEPSSSRTAAADAAQPNDEAPPVPPVESLNLESDYRPFFHPKIDEGLRRAALKKLFSDPHFNVMDGLDVYIDDYSKSEPLPDGMLEQLEQAKKILAWAREDAEARAKAEERDAAADVTAPASANTSALRDEAQPPAHAGAADVPVSAASTPRVE